jgi:hypothetical protein
MKDVTQVKESATQRRQHVQLIYKVLDNLVGETIGRAGLVGGVWMKYG